MKNGLKLLIVMSKYSALGFLCQLMLFSALFASEINAQESKSVKEVFVELGFNEEPLKNVFAEIESATGFKFTIHENERYLNNKFSLTKSKISVERLLLKISEETGLIFQQVNNNIGIREGSRLNRDKTKSIEIIIQTRTISGTVTSFEDGEPLPGVNIIETGTSNGTVTDLSGRYSLTVAEGATLVFSMVGFTSEEMAVGNRSVIDLVMTQDITSLAEIVVIGYGVQEKKDLTGAMSSISSEDLNQGPVTNPLQQISGRAPGVNITQIGNEPGVPPTVRIRGITSLSGGNDPLVVVDGMQGNLNLLNQVPPSEIETIDILKDASATAIYGSRGAAGVIIVTTKQGKEGKTTVEYTSSASVDALSNQLEILSADEWREQARLWNVSYSADHGSDTDWFNILTRRGTTHNHSLAIGGGSGDLNYRASISAILQEGVVINSSNNNYIARLQATQKALNDKLTVTINLNNSIQRRIGSPGDVGRASFRSNLISNAYVSKPTDPVLDEEGDYYFDESVFQYINPYAVAKEVVNESEFHNLFGSLKADLEILQDVTLGWFGSWRKINNNRGVFEPYSSTLPDPRSYNGIATINTDITDEKLMDISIGIDKTYGKHRIKGIGVYEWQGQLYQGHMIRGRDFDNDQTSYHALQNRGSILDGDVFSYKDDRTLVSFLGRMEYGFADKYMATVSVRHDGSSVFGDNYKWGTFPSVSIGWRISEEPFLRAQSFISNLKVRAGYGVTGNQQGLRPQLSKQLVGKSGSVYWLGEEVPNFVVIQNANKDLRWETRYQTNLGIDFGFFNDRLSGSLDIYSATTENLLFNYTVPQPPYPYDRMFANVGSLINEGIELALDYRVITGEDFSLTLGGNVTLMRNEALELSGSLNGVPLNTDYVSWGINSYLIKGKPIGTFYILENAGKDEDTNQELIVDRDGNEAIDQSDRSPDRYFAGSALPTYTFAFTPTVKYKNFDAAMVWRGSGGNKIFNRIKRDFSLFENLGRSNLLKSAVNTGLFTSQYSSDLWLEDGDYIRFENLTIGYTLNTLNIDFISSLRLSLTGNNLALFTKYSGLDPELNVSGGNGSGFDAGMYPRTRSISIGLNATF